MTDTPNALVLRWFRHGGADWDAAAALRTRVFVDEQRVPPELELDDADRTARHLLAVDGDRVVGTLRALDYQDGATKVGRVAVERDARGRGVGLALMREAIAEARRRGSPRVVLDSQVTVIPFYERLDFVAIGGEFLDAGIPHRRMILELGD